MERPCLNKREEPFSDQCRLTVIFASLRDYKTCKIRRLCMDMHILHFLQLIPSAKILLLYDCTKYKPEPDKNNTFFLSNSNFRSSNI